MPELKLLDEGGVGRLELQRPLLAREVLEVLEDTMKKLAAVPDTHPVVLSCAHPRIFLAGAHLADIAALDAHSSRSYAQLGRRVMALVESFPAPVIAAVHGACTGGGLDLVLACDAVVAGPHASFAHPGTRRGLVTGWGGTRALPERLGAVAARRHLLEGSLLSEDALDTLLPLPAAAGEERTVAAEEALRLALLHPARLALWRALKSGSFIDRFRIFVVHNLLRETGSARRGTGGRQRTPSLDGACSAD